jgi:hypothetical protein
MHYNIDKVYFWTDSMTVLRCNFNRNARYHTFVANRLAVIHEATDNDQWNYVNTKLNPEMNNAFFHCHPLIEKNAIPKPMLLASEKQCS